MIIALCGKKGSGKDTVADIIVKDYNFIKYRFADDIKKIAKILFDFTDEQLHGQDKDKLDEKWNITPREFFQKFGTEYIQEIFPKTFPTLFDNINKKEFWLKKFELWYNYHNKLNNNFFVVISDLRFEHEYNYIKNLGGYIIKVERDNLKDKLNIYHISETGLDNYDKNKFNFVIKNNGSKEDLKKIIKKFL